MKTILRLTLILCVTGLVSCTQDEPVSTEQRQSTPLTEISKPQYSGQQVRQRQTKEANPYCFDFEYPVYFQEESGAVFPIADEKELAYLLQSLGSEWIVNYMIYPVLVSNIVTSESNLGDVPIAYDGSVSDTGDGTVGNNIVTSESNLGDVPITYDGSVSDTGDGTVGNNIVTSESNLGDVPKKVTINTPEDLQRLLQSCK